MRFIKDKLSMEKVLDNDMGKLDLESVEERGLLENNSSFKKN